MTTRFDFFIIIRVIRCNVRNNASRLGLHRISKLDLRNKSTNAAELSSQPSEGIS